MAYNDLVNYSKQTLSERFMKRVVPEPNSGCWLWIGKMWPPYGAFYVSGGRKNPLMKRAHVVSYELHVGPVPQGLELDHKCRVPSCVNPQHLEAVTHQVNVQRGMAGRYKHKPTTHCKQGHPYVDVYVDVRGRTECRICKNARARAKYHAKHHPS